MREYPKWLSGLDYEDLSFIKNFLLASGSLKELAKLYHVSYPTLRLRLDRLIEKVRVNDELSIDPYIKLIKSLAIDKKIDAEAAKKLIDEYKKSKGDG